jgi:hypothetical protein
MQLSAIEARFNKITEIVEQTSATKYTTYRDESGNLIIQFNSGECIKLPMVPFRPYQMEVQKALFVDGIRRILLQRPRRSGKELESWNLLVEGAIIEPGLYLVIYPTNVRAKAILWDGAILLPGNVSVKFRDMIPKRFVLGKPNEQEMKIKLTNGSIIWIVGSDIDPDKLRGTNPRGIVLAEFAFCDPRVFYIMLPVLRQNGGWLLGQSTYNGMNHFYRLIDNNKDDPLWYCRSDSIENLVDEKGERYITDAMIDEDRRAGMPEYLIQQEYYGKVQLNQESIYFSNEMNNIYKNEKVISDLYMRGKRCYAFYDIGMNDCTSVCIVQIDERGDPIIINYFEANNKPFRHYVSLAHNFANSLGIRLHCHYVPHDGKKRDWNTGKNTVDYGYEMGEEVHIVPKPLSKINSIEAMRQMLYRVKFNKENCSRLLDCLSNYGKEFDEKNNVYKDAPLHNWASHGVDSFQTLTLAIDGGMINEKTWDVVYTNTQPVGGF